MQLTGILGRYVSLDQVYQSSHYTYDPTNCLPRISVYVIIIRSTIQPDHVFSILEDYREQILTTGKYLNVIRECGQEVTPPKKTITASNKK